MKSRQKILLGLLSLSDKNLSKLEVTKLAFLLKKESKLQYDKDFYEFVPYKYGPFSFELYQDIRYLTKNGYFLNDNLDFESELESDIDNQVKSLPKESRSAIHNLLDKFNSYTSTDLIKYVYDNYSWYAINSELEMAPKLSNKIAEIAVYSAGYEGETIDHFFNKIIKNGIKNIIDIRNNPVSRKYGFSKSQLVNNCSGLGLSYYEFPELGIISDKRKKLKTFADYKSLLDDYEKIIIESQNSSIKKVENIIKNHPSVLICFEKDYNYCHRNRLAKIISNDTGLDIKHI